MQVEKRIDEGLKHREDLIRIVDASAEFLASRDKDADSEVRAVWRLSPGPTGEPRVGLELRDQTFSLSRQFTPNQLVPADMRELRLAEIWTDVAQQRAHRQMARVNELISQLED